MARRGRCVRRGLAARLRAGLSNCFKRSSQIASRSPRFRAPRAAVFLAPPDRILMAPKLGHRY